MVVIGSPPPKYIATTGSRRLVPRRLGAACGPPTKDNAMKPAEQRRQMEMRLRTLLLFAMVSAALSSRLPLP